MIFLNQIEERAWKAAGLTDTSVVANVQIGSSWIMSTVPCVREGTKWVIPGIETVIRAYMQKNDLYTANCRVDMYTDGSNLYTPVNEPLVFSPVSMRKPATLTPYVFCSNYFMSHLKTGWMTPEGPFYLHYYDLTEGGSDWAVTYYMKSGTQQSGTTGHGVEGAGSIPVNYLEGAAMARVIMGSREFRVYFLEFTDYMRFRFRNPFNALEYVALPCSVTEEPMTEFETARQEDVESRYDIEEQLEYKVKTPPLPAFMHDRLLDMCRSRKIEMRDPYNAGSTTYEAWSDVLIKDYKLSRSNDPNKPLVLEMTLTFCNTRRNTAVEFE